LALKSRLTGIFPLATLLDCFTVVSSLFGTSWGQIEGAEINPGFDLLD
jgi:hypothetical protein